jgi:hypothetical protein
MCKKNLPVIFLRPDIIRQMPWKRVTINLEPELAEIAKKRAKARRQSVAAYFASLLEADIKDQVNEPQAPYGVPAPPHGFKEIPGVKPKPGLYSPVPAPPHIQNPVQPFQEKPRKRA